MSSSVACPQCRQAAVYRGAVRMRQLDRVVRSRCGVIKAWKQGWLTPGQAVGCCGVCVAAAYAPAPRSYAPPFHTPSPPRPSSCHQCPMLRFPHEWQERRQEERARERAVVEAAAAAAQPGRAWMHTRDALLGM